MVKSENGMITTDVVLSIVAIMVFSLLFVALMYNNALENNKLKLQGLAIADITQTFESIGIANYSNVTNANADSFIPHDVTAPYGRLYIERRRHIEKSYCNSIL